MQPSACTFKLGATRHPFPGPSEALSTNVLSPVPPYPVGSMPHLQYSSPGQSGASWRCSAVGCMACGKPLFSCSATQTMRHVVIEAEVRRRWHFSCVGSVLSHCCKGTFPFGIFRSEEHRRHFLPYVMDASKSDFAGWSLLIDSSDTELRDHGMVS